MAGGAAVEFQGILAAFQHPGGRAAEVFSVWVDPAARGRGIAATMLTVAVEWAAEQGCQTVVLKVFERNTSAQRLYERSGFHRTDYVGRHQLTGLPEVEMVRDLIINTTTED